MLVVKLNNITFSEVQKIFRTRREYPEILQNLHITYKGDDISGRVILKYEGPSDKFRAFVRNCLC